MTISAIVYDIEIIKAVPYKNEPPVPGIAYCAGWHDHENMGISVIGAYDFTEDRYRVFCEDNFHAFFELIAERKLLIGFNSVRFDSAVLNFLPHCRDDFGKDPRQYDLLREIWISLGLDPDIFVWQQHGGFSLDAMCSANGLRNKTGHGAIAPALWQQGNIGTVIDYCLNDVTLTKELFLLSQKSSLVSPKGGELLLRKVLHDQTC